MNRSIPFLLAMMALLGLFGMHKAHAQTDGFFDTTFAGTGYITFNGDNKNANALTKLKKMIVASNGNVLLAGLGSNPNSAGNYWWLGEVSSAGQFVTSFGASDESGRITECQLGFVCFSNADGFSDAALQSDGRVLVLANQLSRTSANAMSLDTTGVVGGTGHIATQFTINDVGGTVSAIGGLLPGANGKLFAFGFGTYSPTKANSFGIVRLNSDLSLDTSFNAMTDGNGVTFAGGQAIDIATNAYASSAALQSDGHIVLAGTTFAGGGLPVELLVTRLNPDGSLDTTFGNDGLVDDVASETIYGVTAPSLAIDSADRILVTISTQKTLGSNLGVYMLIGRFTPTGVLDSSFGASGWASNDSFPACPNGADAVTMAIDSAGRILAAGTCLAEFGIERVRGDNGALDTSFGFSGFSHGSFSPTSNQDAISVLAIDAGGRPLFGGSSYPAGGGEPQVGVGRLTYDLIFTNNFEKTARGCSPPNCN